MTAYLNKTLTIKKQELSANTITLGDLKIINDGKDMGFSVFHNSKKICFVNEPGAIFLLEWLKHRETEVQEVVIVENYNITELYDEQKKTKEAVEPTKEP